MTTDGHPDIGHQWSSLVMSVAAHRTDGDKGPAGLADAAATPVTLLTGFLGAGKSTILARLLSDPGDVGIIRAVVNDVGRLPFDPALIDEASSDGRVDGAGGRSGGPGVRSRVELTNGCGCCVAGAATELGDRLEENAPGADLLVLEASGVADPIALAQVVAARPCLRLDRTVAVVDARAVEGLLAMPAVAPVLHRQLDAAQAVILSHADDLTVGGTEAVVERLAALAPGAPIMTSTLSEPAHRVLTPGVRIGARLSPASQAIGEGPVAHSFEAPCEVGSADLTAAVEAAGADLLRAKGRLVVDGRPHLVQFTPSGLRLTPDRPGPVGLTVVVSDPAAVAPIADLLG